MNSLQASTSHSFVQQELRRDARVFTVVALMIAVMLGADCEFMRSAP